MLHIDQRHLAAVRAILDRLAPGLEVWAFGSRVHGRSLKPFSDLDLAIVSACPLDVHTLEALRDAFAESDLPFRVDVVDLATAGDRFRAVVEAEHVALAP